ncbi:hypothetical protein [Nocardia cyriacigeorgica]|uniref:Uncharacterized protein n=1 Tax=Nocardia cyriacigeorgica TaxID=135487 RepID=A0A5R8PEC7_9NOCA|nr:hypothetical protein [Nocardia cyriacigeorgica]MBF6095750.1 hypothetical protein [Nocardia cyriacigeorgica]TLF73647.1 hypothetical protein FEK34_26530 [Nocardia cyriacigeorgica]TLG10262.1 hypothetical protein FEK35_13750 [Nocardia cyriacigeorgica]
MSTTTTTTVSTAELATTDAALRRDFTRFHNLRTIAPHADTPAQARTLLAQAAKLADRWTNGPDPDARALWHELESAVAVWNARPETTARAFRRLSQAHNAGDIPIEDRTWQTLNQAAELTGHLTTTIAGSNQDSARWTPTQPAAKPSNCGGSLLDRALGGHAAEPVGLDEVAAVIAETDRLLAIEELCGDRDTGADDHTYLLPPPLHPTPTTATGDAESRRTNALITLQNLTAEHTRLAGEWDGPLEEVDTLVARLESLLCAIRDARRAAATAGVPVADIEATYRAGSGGQYWHPPVPPKRPDSGRDSDGGLDEITPAHLETPHHTNAAGDEGACSGPAFTRADDWTDDRFPVLGGRDEHRVDVEAARS